MAGNNATPATVQNLLAQMMQNHSVVNGWDIVTSLKFKNDEME